MNVKLIAIENRWGQPLYPPQPPLPKVADLLPEKGPLRPMARMLLNPQPTNRSHIHVR